MTVSSAYELRVVLSDDTINVIENVSQTQQLPDQILRCLKDRSASVDDVKAIYSFLKESKSGVRLHEVLGQCNITLPTPVVSTPSPEYEERIQRLKAEQADREYRAITRNVAPPRHRPDDSIAHQMRYMNRQLVAVAQFVFSVAAGFAFGFFGVEMMLGNLDFGFRLLLGVICALVIALAEIYFLAKILAEMDEEEVGPKPVVSSFPSKAHQD